MSTKKLQVLDYKIKQAENADTIDGKHALDFATATDMGAAQSSISDLQTKVGDTSVSDQIATGIANKVDKVDGKGLSTNDYTTAEKNKLAGIATGATKVTVDSALSSSSTNPVQNKVVNTEINGLKTLVGDTAVSTQITNAISSNRMVYTQNDEPPDAPVGALWVNMESQYTDDFVSVYNSILIFGTQFVALVDNETLKI